MPELALDIGQPELLVGEVRPDEHIRAPPAAFRTLKAREHVCEPLAVGIAGRREAFEVALLRLESAVSGLCQRRDLAVYLRDLVELVQGRREALEEPVSPPGIVVIVVEPYDIDILVAGISGYVSAPVRKRAVRRIAESKVPDAPLAAQVVYRVAEEFLVLVGSQVFRAPPEPVAVALVERAEDHGDGLAVDADALAREVCDHVKEPEVLGIEVAARHYPSAAVVGSAHRRVVVVAVPAEREVRHVRGQRDDRPAAREVLHGLDELAFGAFVARETERVDADHRRHAAREALAVRVCAVLILYGDPDVPGVLLPEHDPVRCGILADQRDELPDGFVPWVSLAHYLLPLYPAGLTGFFSGCCIFFWKSPKGSCMSEMSPPRFWIADIIS